jgi:rare lipoprotein A
MRRWKSLSRLRAVPFQARFLPALFCGAALGLAGCAQQQATHGSEYFPQSVYGQASPRVVADNTEVPRGGGSYKVGQPYTIAGKTYYPSDYKRYSGVGLASWYGDAFHGRRTANGEIYDSKSISAAHPTMPLPSYARVTNLRNNYSIIVRVNDRGPFAHDRVMDVSHRVADLLDFRSRGTARVKVDYIGPASLAGSDDRKLAQTLRQDGRLAQLDMHHPPTYVAETRPVQTAAAEIKPPPASTANAAVEPPLTTTPTAFTGPLPLPPTRPFDLDIMNADGEMSAQR